jgi:hypothetical protein
MSERTPNMDLLFAVRDLGLPEPLPDSIDIAVRVALTRTIHADAGAPVQRFRSVRRLGRRGPLIALGLIVTSAVAAAATGLVRLPSPQKFARRNASDSALTLFRKSVPYQGGTSTDNGATVVPYKENVIPSSVREIAKPAVPGVGAVQFWVGVTKQHGYCVALRLPNGSWAGLTGLDGVGGSIPGCQPTRAQVGAGALILSGFDYTDEDVLTRGGGELDLVYGQIVAPGHPTKVRDDFSRATTSVIDGKYFMLVLQAGQSNDVHLVALNASGRVVADETKPLPGTPTVKCVGRYNVRRHRIPGTKRTSLTWSCRHYVRKVAK